MSRSLKTWKEIQLIPCDFKRYCYDGKFSPKTFDSTKTASKHNNRILYKQRKEKVIETQLQSANIFSILKNIILLSNMICPRVSENCKLTSSDFVGIQKELHCSDVYWCNRRPWLEEMYCVVNLQRLSPFSSSKNKISITSRTILNG